MPVYDYVCNDCQKTFERTLTLRQHDGQVRCPQCGGKMYAGSRSVLRCDFEEKRLK